MKAEDTILDKDKLLRIRQHTFYDNPGTITTIQENTAKAQAEISFRAGEDKGYAHAIQHCEDVIIPQAEAQAIREVIERYKADNPSMYKKYHIYWENLVEQLLGDR